MRLLSLLEALPEPDFLALCRVRGVSFEPTKRIGQRDQARRALADIRGRLAGLKGDANSLEDLAQLASSGAGCPHESLPGGGERLRTLGLIFDLPGQLGWVCLPAAYRLQVAATPSDSPRAIRVLLQGLKPDVLRAVCREEWGRSIPLHPALLLEPVLERIEAPLSLAHCIAELPGRARDLLAGMDTAGGEVDGEAILELEKDPRRIVVGNSQAVPRHSSIHNLVALGLAMPLSTSSWCLPREVERLVGVERMARIEGHRARIDARIRAADLTPPRARLACASGPAMAAVLCSLLRQGQALVRPGGVPRSALRRAARMGLLTEDGAGMLVSLGRASASLAASDERVDEASARLFRGWWRGGGWDELLREPDRFRHVRRQPPRTCTTRLRDALLELLMQLPPGEFVLEEDVRSVVLEDGRAEACRAALARGGEVCVASVEAGLDRMLRQSLPTLGVVDLAEVEAGSVLRLAAHARGWFGQAGERALDVVPAAAWAGAGRLRIETGALLSEVLAIAPFGEVWARDEGLVAVFDKQSLDDGLLLDGDSRALLHGLRRMTGEPTGWIEEQLELVERTRVVATLVPASGYLPLADPGLRVRLLEQPGARDLFWLEQSPDEGLLIRPGASQKRLRRALVAVGIRLDGHPAAGGNTENP